MKWKSKLDDASLEIDILSLLFEVGSFVEGFAATSRVGVSICIAVDTVVEVVAVAVITSANDAEILLVLLAID